MQITFNSMVEEHFHYLIDEYNFRVVKVREEIQHDVAAEGYVEYESPTTFVTVTGEWYWNGVVFGRSKDDRRFSLSAEQIYEYISLTPDERGLVCSHDPNDDRAAALLVASKELQHEKRHFDSKAEEIDSQLSDHAGWLKIYAEPFLTGDFSQWLEIYEYKVSRMIAELKRSGKKEYSLRLAGKDENGKAIHINEHVFIKSLDYLAQLRER